MTLRGFLACYLGAVVIVGGVGASAYQGLQRRHVATQAAAPARPVALAEATQDTTSHPAPAPGVALAPLVPAPLAAAAPPTAKPLPKLRLHVATATGVNQKPWPRVAVTRPPIRQPPRFARVYQPQPYGPPPEMPYGYYASPAYYPYGGYYGGYGYYPPRYGYYRSY